MAKLIDISLANTNTIIWDLDGTILDSFGISLEIWDGVLARRGLPALAAEDLARNYHGSLADTARSLLGKGANDEEVESALNEFIGVDNTYIKAVDQHLFEDAVRLIVRAHKAGCRQIIVTNRAHGIDRQNASPRNMIENSSLRTYIDRVICGDDAEHRKPKPEVLAEVIYDPVTTLVIGDQYVDAEFAHNLHARAVLVNREEMPIAHLERLQGREDRYTIVRSLDEVR
jgi:phosphoglycolate phosphatase-like HAD superfamily hydrolase